MRSNVHLFFLLTIRWFYANKTQTIAFARIIFYLCIVNLNGINTYFK